MLQSRVQPARLEVRFPLGGIVMTQGIHELVVNGQLNPLPWLMRHARCDWGDLSDADRQLNNQAVNHMGRLMSSYEVTPQLQVWIITEGDRSLTTMQLPSEY